MNAKRYQIPTDELIRLLELKTSLHKLLRKVCEVTEYSIKDMEGVGRKHPLPYTRSAYAYIAKETYPDATLGLIGSMIDKDHSTVHSMLKGIRDTKEKRVVYLDVKEKLKL